MDFSSEKKLAIVDYFDLLKNQIDLDAENLIAKHLENNLLNEFINRKRDEFLNEIDLAQEANLNECSRQMSSNGVEQQKVLNNSELFTRYCFYVNLSEIHKFPVYIREFIFGILVVTDGYLEQKEIDEIK